MAGEEYLSHTKKKISPSWINQGMRSDFDQAKLWVLVIISNFYMPWNVDLLLIPKNVKKDANKYKN